MLVGGFGGLKEEAVWDKDVRIEAGEISVLLDRGGGISGTDAELDVLTQGIGI